MQAVTTGCQAFFKHLFNDIIQWLLPGLNKGGHRCLFFHFAISIITNQQFPVVKCHSHLFKEWSRCGHQRLVWLRSCWVGIECLLKTKNRDQMAGWVARLLIMSFQEQCNHSVRFITYWKCKRCIFNRIEHVLPDCDCTFMTYTSPYKSGHSRCRGLLLRPFVLESSVAMTTISLWAVVMDTKGPWWSPRDDSESGLHKDTLHRIFTSVVGKQPD